MPRRRHSRPKTVPYVPSKADMSLQPRTVPPDVGISLIPARIEVEQIPGTVETQMNGKLEGNGQLVRKNEPTTLLIYSDENLSFDELTKDDTKGAGQTKDGPTAKQADEIMLDVEDTQSDIEMEAILQIPHNDLTDSSGDESEPQVLPVGSLVWARYSKLWWPAILIKGEMAGQANTNDKLTWVMWFGDHKISKVPRNKAVCFALHVKEYFSEKLSNKHEAAVIEALKVCVDRHGLRVEGYKFIKKWGMSDVGLATFLKTNEDPFKPLPGSELPHDVVDILNDLREAAGETTEDSESDTDEDMEVQDELGPDFPPDVSAKDFCMVCCSKKQDIVDIHPLFEGFLCQKCKAVLEERLLGLGGNGYYMFCTVCCAADSGYVCCQKNCGRTFCSKCLKRYLGTHKVMEINKQLPWECLLCKPYDPDTHSVLRPRNNRQQQLIKFFNPIDKRVTYLPDFAERKLRVLSLYDGIGTVKYTLDELGIDIAAYYSAESDVAARMVSKQNNKKPNFHRLGDVKQITSEQLKAICPIDLVVANPPDYDLDVTNKEHKGFNGTGDAMFKVMSILRDIERLCAGRPVFWLVESCPTMMTACRQYIDNLFEMKHCMWDAQFVSPYVCPRLYWGNIPGLCGAPSFYIKHKTAELTLKQCLDRGRKPLVSMLRKCAIDYQPKNKGSQQTKCKTAIDQTLFELPVSEDGDASVIRVEEVEKILGLPDDYSYVKTNTLEIRQNLLKTAPSARILKQILEPLGRMFLTKKRGQSTS